MAATCDADGSRDQRLTTALRQVLDGRRVVVATGSATTADRLARECLAHGARDVLAVAGQRDDHQQVRPDGAAPLVLDVGGRGIMASIRALEAALASPPRVLHDAIEAFDPHGTALVVVPPFVQLAAVAGRPVLGARPGTWRRLEDKTTVDELWDAAGVPRAPRLVVPLDRAAEVWRDLDAGAGTVWAADNAAGWHGGAEGVHRVRAESDAAAVTAALRHRAERVRVMPFLEGRPCSIHGWLSDDELVVFRPCELLVLRERHGTRLRYAGFATTWRPAAPDEAAIVEVARLVGSHLDDVFRYRGVFTVDGVLTADGFRPTELNPRFGAALGALGRGSGLPLQLLHAGTVHAPALDWHLRALRDHVVTSSLESPTATAGLLLDHEVDRRRTFQLLDDGEIGPVGAARRLVEQPPGEERERPSGAIAVEVGPGPFGSRLQVVADDHAPGQPLAPVVVVAADLVARRLGWPPPGLEAAPDPPR